MQAKRKDLFGDDQDVWEIGASPYLAARHRRRHPGRSRPTQAGLKAGDVVVALEGQPVMSWDELAEKIHQRAGQPTRLEVKRGTETLTITVTPKKGKVPGPDGKEMEVGLRRDPPRRGHRDGPLEPALRDVGRRSRGPPT